MKFKTLCILWHDESPILSVDFHKSGRFATAGADKFVRIWKYKPPSSQSNEPQVEFLSTLKTHEKAVNCVRFSPDGHFLASCGDDGHVHIWELDQGPQTNTSIDNDLVYNVERWKVIRSYQGAQQGIYALGWSPNSNFLVSGSFFDNTVTIWDARENSTRDKFQEFADHSKHVLGVSWDPRDEFIVSQSTDCSTRVYQKKSTNGKFDKHCQIRSRLLQGVKPPPASAVIKDDTDPSQTQTKPTAFKANMYLGENGSSFFRRPGWTPDGRLLYTPGAIIHEDMAKLTEAPSNTTYIFLRSNISTPVAHIKSPKPSVVAAANPNLYKLKEADTLFDLPYRMWIAIATVDTITLYDTASLQPKAMVSDCHYAPITDLAWAPDGQTLIISSMDGFCSIFAFSEEELGEKMTAEESAPYLRPPVPVETPKKRKADVQTYSPARCDSPARPPAYPPAEPSSHPVQQIPAPSPLLPGQPVASSATAEIIIIDGDDNPNPRPKKRMAPSLIATPSNL